MLKLAAQPGTRPSVACYTSAERDPSKLVLVDIGAPRSLPRSPIVAGGFWAVILSRAAWKKSWAGRDPTRSIIPADRSVAITGDTARAQLLTA